MKNNNDSKSGSGEDNSKKNPPAAESVFKEINKDPKRGKKVFSEADTDEDFE